MKVDLKEVDEVGRHVPRNADTRASSLSIIPVALVAMMVVAAAFGAFRSVTAGSESSGVVDSASIPEPSRERPATIENTLVAAVDQARKWDSRARLMAVTAQYDFPIAADGARSEAVGGWIIYTFVRGAGDDTEALTLLIERSAAVIVRESVRHLGTSASTIDTGAIQSAFTSSTVALERANTVAGTAFRAGCPVRRFAIRLAFRAATDTAGPRWVVTYIDARSGSGPILRVVIDAASGEAGVWELQQTEPDRSELDACDA